MTPEEKEARRLAGCARTRAWRAANKERKAAANLLWAAKNKDKVAAWGSAWKKANPDKVRASNAARAPKQKLACAAYRKANPEKVRVTKAASYQKHKEARLAADEARRKKNPEAKRVHIRNRRARKRLCEGTHTSSDTMAIRAAQKDRCAYCRTKLNGSGHLDHIKALSRGGSNWPSNLQWLCAPCNITKGATDPMEFAQRKGLLL